MDKKPVVLSKSKYLQGLQCPKLLWYEYNSKNSFPPIDAATQAIFDEGRRVGEYAQKLFPDGIRLERDYDPRRQSQKSLEALKLRQPLFEAGFVFDRAYDGMHLLQKQPRCAITHDYTDFRIKRILRTIALPGTSPAETEILESLSRQSAARLTRQQKASDFRPQASASKRNRDLTMAFGHLSCRRRGI